MMISDVVTVIIGTHNTKCVITSEQSYIQNYFTDAALNANMLDVNIFL